MPDHEQIGRDIQRRLAAIAIKRPQLDLPMAQQGLLEHFAALGVSEDAVRWLTDPSRFRHELAVRSGSNAGSWHRAVRRRAPLLDGFHHRGPRWTRLPDVPTRNLQVAKIDSALVLRVVGRWETPRLVRCVTADLASIASRLRARRFWAADPLLDSVEPLLRAAERGLFSFAVAHDGSMLAVARPTLRFDREGRLHDWDGLPAVEWEGYHPMYFWRGVEMTRLAGHHPERVTARQVLGWRNAERRRVAIERFGWDWFVDRLGLVEAQADDFGRLLRSPRDIDGERVQLVEVVNASREPDGTYRRYLLRVPPMMRTACEAVAWTFGFDDPREYLVSAAS